MQTIQYRHHFPGEGAILPNESRPYMNIHKSKQGICFERTKSRRRQNIELLKTHILWK